MEQIIRGSTFNLMKSHAAHLNFVAYSTFPESSTFLFIYLFIYLFSLFNVGLQNSWK